MPTPIIMAAFGTSPVARATYQFIDQQVRNHFREHLILWSYAPRNLQNRLEERDSGSFRHHMEAIQAISDQGYRQAVVQSLHLLPGQEFHRYFLECQEAALSCSVGMPVLFRPEDYRKLADCLAPIILNRPDKAILLLGHGTSHPVWVAYNALENIFRRRFGQRIFVGVMEKYPESEEIPLEISNAGFRQVCIIPLLIVAGMHFSRDIIGSGDRSWLVRLQRQGLEVETMADGLGRLPGFSRIIIDHIEEASRVAERQSPGNDD